MDYVREHAAANPAVAADLEEAGALLRDKLWFQLSAKLMELSANPHFQEVPRMVGLYDGLVGGVEKNLKPLHVAQLAVAAARQQSDRDAALAFLAPFEEKLAADAQAPVLVQLAVSEIHLAAGDAPKSLELLERAQQAIKDYSGVMEGLVHSAAHRTALLFYRARGPASSFFDSAIMYLAYTPIENIPEAERKELASAVGLAALVGKNVFNFGELLEHPVVDVLRGSEFDWLHQLLLAFNRGDIDRFKAVAEAQGSSTEVLAKNAAFLNQKVRIMALMEMVFTRASDDRVLTFREVGEACQLQVHEVELLLMKAFSIGVVRGQIDQVEQTVAMSWVQPRVLNKEQIAGMRDRLRVWSARVDGTARELESSAGELLAAHKAVY